jgi:hypothetical protein
MSQLVVVYVNPQLITVFHQQLMIDLSEMIAEFVYFDQLSQTKGF